MIRHSDPGAQYISIEFGHRCRDADVRRSMGSVGDAYDKAMCERVSAPLECEQLRQVQSSARLRSLREYLGRPAIDAQLIILGPMFF